MKKLVVATHNRNKIREIGEILPGWEIAAEDSGAEETADTFAGNALIKARAIAPRHPGAWVMADDSGLEVDALGGEPGIYSARYMGEDTPYSVKNANIIERLNGVPDEKRTARFVCAIAAVFPNGQECVRRATIEGRIDYAEKGEHGFGFDPIFYVPELGCTTAEIPEEEKNQISHRGKALRLMKEDLLKYEDFGRK